MHIKQDLRSFHDLNKNCDENDGIFRNIYVASELTKHQIK